MAKEYLNFNKDIFPMDNMLKGIFLTFWQNLVIVIKIINK
jgi:hypothetical protein